MQNDIEKLFAAGWERSRAAGSVRGELVGNVDAVGIKVFSLAPSDGQSEVIISGGEMEHIQDHNGETRAMIQHPKHILAKVNCFTIKKRKLITGQVRGELRGGALYLRGELTQTFTAFDLSTTPPTLIRRDISLADLRQAGGILPPMYFDELGNMRGGNDELIFAGPNNPK